MAMIDKKCRERLDVLQTAAIAHLTEHKKFLEVLETQTKLNAESLDICNTLISKIGTLEKEIAELRTEIVELKKKDLLYINI